MKVNLLRLKFANILSFKDEQEIFFTAESKYTNMPTNYIRNEKAIGEEMITPVTAFYGANASGKSNIIKILNEIVSSLLNRMDKKPSSDFYQPFALSEEMLNKPSLIEIDFSVEAKRYILSMTFDKEGILSENLVEYAQKTKNILYKREKDKLVKTDKKIISKFDTVLTETSLEKRKDLLVLDILDTRGLAYIHKIFEALKEITKTTFANIIATYLNIDDLAEKLYNSPKLLSQVIAFIKYADLGVVGLKVLKNEPQSANKYRILFEHKGKDGKLYDMPMNSESTGTNQFAKYLVTFIPSLLEGGIFVVDELEENLHPMMLAKLVEMFNVPNINKGRAQLIFSTHDTSILKSDILKRDEIWFVEKNEEGCSEVYPLTEFKSIREGFNYEKGYLEGRFGAIPYLGDIKELEAILNA
jgi:AAA15 family ATPase/GTPase